jgi:hypothetical protein
MADNLISGLTVEQLENDAIIAYTLSSAQSSTIAAWSDLAVANLHDWPKDRPYLALHDLSHPGVGLLYLTAVEFDPFNVGVTPGGRRAVYDLMAEKPDWQIVLALVVSTSLSGRLTRLRVADIISDLPRITSRTFFKRSAALEWLMRFNQTPATTATSPAASLVVPPPAPLGVAPVAAPVPVAVSSLESKDSV